MLLFKHTEMLTPYLIFVIFLHRQNFWRIRFTPKMRKISSKLPIFRVKSVKIAKFTPKTHKLHSKLTIFRVKSVKIYTGPKKLHGHRYHFNTQ